MPSPKQETDQVWPTTTYEASQRALPLASPQAIVYPSLTLSLTSTCAIIWCDELIQVGGATFVKIFFEKYLTPEVLASSFVM